MSSAWEQETAVLSCPLLASQPPPINNTCWKPPFWTVSFKSHCFFVHSLDALPSVQNPTFSLPLVTVGFSSLLYQLCLSWIGYASGGASRREKFSELGWQVWKHSASHSQVGGKFSHTAPSRILLWSRAGPLSHSLSSFINLLSSPSMLLCLSLCPSVSSQALPSASFCCVEGLLQNPCLV